MQFEKKKSVLKYLGKDGKDVRALSRMIERWEVKYDWIYYTVGGVDKIESKPEEDIKNFLPEEKTTSSKVDTDTSKVDVSNSDVEYYKWNMEFYKYISEEIYDRVVDEIKRYLGEKKIFPSVINELLNNLEWVKKQVLIDADMTWWVRE